jgi:hypothetical protein
MKHNRKKLSLNKEAIQQLTPKQLSGAVGGIIKTDFDGPCSATNVQCATGDVCSRMYCSAATCYDPCPTVNSCTTCTI